MPPNQNTVSSKQSLRIAIIGQSAFAVDVLQSLRQHGHVIVGVFTIIDKSNREDPLAKIANELEIPLFKIKAWRKQGKPLPEVLELYKSVRADLNVLPYCTQFIPMEVINFPRYQSICYHPSLLPRHRGASSINWTLICGDPEAGLTIFWADDGLDTGPILLQERCNVQENDTVDSLYKRFLYPVGVAAVAKAVDLVAAGIAPKEPQSEKGATYDPMLNKIELQQIVWQKTALELHNFIRGMDSVPGAACQIKLPQEEDYKSVLLFGSSLWKRPKPTIDPDDDTSGLIQIKNADFQGLIHEDGLLLQGSDGAFINIKRIKIDGRMRNASTLLQKNQHQIQLQHTEEEKVFLDLIRASWEAILGLEIESETDFFASGAGSMDVVRLVEETKAICKLENIENEDVFMNPTFEEYCNAIFLKGRENVGGVCEVDFKGVEIEANNLTIRIPTQLFIDGKFVDAEDSSKTLDCINPSDESLICKVQSASARDVDVAVKAAKRAFEKGEWSKISARERGLLLYKLADLMHQHREELATIESLDSGAVYTLALKTHVGMSVETWRYFAGWTDKIQGTTIPITHARPNRNLTFTKKEPIGVCGLITPWNYPLMMLSWKMAACLAAGNTVIIKPAQVSPLTALKFAELSVKAGIPPGVINVLPGTGSTTGTAIASHPLVRKLGFTGSTEIGKIIMRTCADSNLKKVSLELGGKSPLVIFNDCDLDRAVRFGMQSVFFNKGENCIAAGRLFVESDVHDEFVRRVVREARRIQIGDPLNRATSHGPQNHQAHLLKLLDFVRRGVEEGAKLEWGGRRLERPGYYFEPTIFSNVEDDMYIAKEESFGPIMIISRFDNGDLDGVLRRANATEYGLASGIFTSDLSKALRFSERIEAGTVFVNTYNKTDVGAPFGGFKQSGFGKDLGREALDEYLKTKCVTMEY